MAEFLFINPSPNMELVAKSVYNTGRTAESIYTKDFVQTKPENIWAFTGERVIKLGGQKMAADVHSYLCAMKKPFFAKFRYKFVKERLSAIHPNLSSAAFHDYILLTSSFWNGADLPVKISDMSFEQIVDKNSSSVLITSRYPASGGKSSMSRWRTDYDIKEALGGDYFFFYDGKARHEIYCHNNEIVCVSDAKDKLDWLKEMNPTLARFAFEKTGSVNFHQNLNPWIQKYSSKVFLLNDYSWQGVSVQMPENWAKSVAKFICFDKKAK